MREIGISPRFSRDKFVPLQTKQRYSTRDISGEVFLTLFFRGFVPFLSLADFVSRDKNLQVADLQRLKSCFRRIGNGNHQKGSRIFVGVRQHHYATTPVFTPYCSSSKVKILGRKLTTKCAQVGQRACPCWVTCLPQVGKHVAPKWEKTS